MSHYIPENLRQLAAERAGHRCEYCRIRESDSFLSFQVDHVISLKHGGPTEPGNLAVRGSYALAHFAVRGSYDPAHFFAVCPYAGGCVIGAGS